MSLWTFTEVSQILGCSVQNISNRKGTLKSLGFIEVDNKDGKEKINEKGYNYLMEKRKNTIKQQSKKLSNNLVNEQESTTNTGIFESKQQEYTDNLIVDFLKNEIEDLKKQIAEEKEQKQYWQNLYIQQNEDFKKLAFPPMLDTQEGNRETEEKQKRGFWNRIFN